MWCYYGHRTKNSVVNSAWNGGKPDKSSRTGRSNYYMSGRQYQGGGLLKVLSRSLRKTGHFMMRITRLETRSVAQILFTDYLGRFSSCAGHYFPDTHTVESRDILAPVCSISGLLRRFMLTSRMKQTKSRTVRWQDREWNRFNMIHLQKYKSFLFDQ